MALLGRTASGLFWMQRYIERAENMARLLDAGLRLSVTNLSSAEPDEWESLIVSAGVEGIYRAKHERFERDAVVDFLLRDPDNASSVLSSIAIARTNGRVVRTALTQDVWEALNESWMILKHRLAGPVDDLPAVLNLVKARTALIRGAFHGTMLRNEILDFCNLGTFIERADNTARILDVKYWVLLPTHSAVGSPLDNFQWGSILRSVSALRSFAWQYEADINAVDIVDFLVLNRRMPRSLAYSYASIEQSLAYLAGTYGTSHACHVTASAIAARLEEGTVRTIIDGGLHEFIETLLLDNNRLSNEIAQSYSFYS